MGERGKKVRRGFGISTKQSKSADLDWPVIEADYERVFPATLRSAIDALVQNYSSWRDVGQAGWTYVELIESAKKVETAIFEFREMVIDGKFLPDHPEGVGMAAVQFASIAKQAALLLPISRAVSEIEHSPEVAEEAGVFSGDSRSNEVRAYVLQFDWCPQARPIVDELIQKGPVAIEDHSPCRRSIQCEAAR